MLAMTDGNLGYDDLRPLMALQTGDEKHDAASTSTLDVLWVLYDAVLDIAAERLDDPARDRFFLSKGHGPSAYYAVLAAKGFIPVNWLPTFGGFDSPLGYHPDRNLVPGVEVSPPGRWGTAYRLRSVPLSACAHKASGRASSY